MCQNICDSFFLNCGCFVVVVFLFFVFLFFVLFLFFIFFFLFVFVLFCFLVFFCKLRQTNFRYWCFEKEELFFVS